VGDTALVEVEELRKSYRVGDVSVHALRGVDLSIPAGAFVAVIGASGSGKSTFMNIVGLLDRPSGGRYLLAGEDVSGFDKDQRAQLRNRKIGFVFQSFNLLPRTSALENVELPLLYDGGHTTTAQRHARARALLERVGLAERVHHTPAQLSGGQQQRVAIARALVNEPELLLADEPTGNLDSRTGIEIMDVLQRLNRERRLSIVLVTHEADIAEYAERTITFRDGRVVADRPAARRRDAAAELQALPPAEAELTP
jgi:putative ABC transport system ATP-binding protein